MDKSDEAIWQLKIFYLFRDIDNHFHNYKKKCSCEDKYCKHYQKEKKTLFSKRARELFNFVINNTTLPITKQSLECPINKDI